MTFSEKLNEYRNRYAFTQSQLSNVSGLSASVLSRYFSGERTPSEDSPHLEALVSGIFEISKESDSAISKEELLREFRLILVPYRPEELAKKFDGLVRLLDIRINDLAKFMGYDPSYLSRIRNGQRGPGNQNDFVNNFCRYISERYRDEFSVRNISSYISADTSHLLESKDAYREALVHWFGSPVKGDECNSTEHFLHTMDDFDLNEYIKAIRFDELKVPTLPFQLPTAKDYYGIEGFCQAELDFLKSTVLSASTEPLFMCSDMPMEDMAATADFGKKWMFGLAMILKKGMHINIVHNLDRTYDELMLGLEAWLPLYMTGQVNPYYLKNKQNEVYGHLNYFSGTAALEAECITGYHSSGRYHLTRNKRELEYYRKKSENLLSRALPLMEIYREENAVEFSVFKSKEKTISNKRHNILPAPPLHSIPDSILAGILERNNVSREQSEEIMAFIARQKEEFATVIEGTPVHDEVPLVSEDEFKLHPISISLSELFIERDLPYTYQEYLSHIDSAREEASRYENYRLTLTEDAEFRNTCISILEGKYVTVSKAKAPAVHFVIHHPLLKKAIEKLTVAMKEQPEKY